MSLRAVMAGCGQQARQWVRAARDVGGIEIIGLADIDPGAAQTLATEADLNGVRVGTDLGELLDETAPDLLFDIVVPDARRDVVAAGLSHGAHVLSEKPMATSLDEAREIVALGRTANRVHAIVQNRRYVEGIRRLQGLVASGAIGELTALHCDFFVGPHFGGFREEMDHPLLLDMAIHTFDAARLISGRNPRSVLCEEFNPAGSWYAHAASANALFTLDDGAVFTYRGSWCAEGLPTSWEGSWRLIGTRGSATWDGADAYAAEQVTGVDAFLASTRPIDVPQLSDASCAEGHASVLREFVGAIRGGTRPETHAEDNIRSLAMVLAAIESAETGHRVTIEQELAA